MPTKKELLRQIEELKCENTSFRMDNTSTRSTIEEVNRLHNSALQREAKASNDLRAAQSWLKEAKEKNAILKDALRLEALRLAVQAVQPQSVTQTAGKYLKFLAGEEDD